MNMVTNGNAQSWRAKYGDDPEVLSGRWVRSVETRKFAYIREANINGVDISPSKDEGPVRTLTLDQLARLYNLIDEDRAREIME